MLFAEDDLVGRGFIGFRPLLALDADRVAGSGGVYVVVRRSVDPPVFTERSGGGWFKGKDPTVAMSVLESKWVEGCPAVYVGKATSLRKRLRQYRDFGRGRPVGHWGGRYIWQLADASELVVGWQSTADPPRTVESGLLADFRSEFGRLPFANINN